MSKFNDAVQAVVVEGGRVFWTAVEAAAGVVATAQVPESVFAYFGAYGFAVKGAAVVAIAAVATRLKEAARKHLASRAERAVVEAKDK